MEETKKMIHKMTMESREKLFLTGVEDIDSFNENEILAYTSEGLLCIKGKDLHINRLSVDDGELWVEGEIDSLTYSNAMQSKGGFFGKLLR
ncbi:MAG: sporulation protein YabP [Clostridia bacterium]|nr:sporulation protein YabP [Clostridia bacterium]